MERWLKLDANFPHTRSCLRMQERFGRDGPYVWVCVLTAAKRATPEGEFVYTDPGWPELGLAKDPPAFTLDEFFRLTGQLHLTARRRSGDVSTINLRTWDGWQAAWQRDDDRQRKSRKRAESQPDTPRTQNGNAPDGNRTEKEIEKEKYPPNPPRGEVQQIYEHWRKARSKTDRRFDKISPQRRRKIESRLQEFSSDELHRAIDAVARDPWPERSLHDDLTTLFRSQEQVDKFLSLERKPAAAACPECGIGGGTHLAECPVGIEQKARLR